MRQSRVIRIAQLGLVSLSAALLTGCPSPKIVRVNVYCQSIPASLLRDCEGLPGPVKKGDTHEDLRNAYLAYKECARVLQSNLLAIAELAECRVKEDAN